MLLTNLEFCIQKGVAIISPVALGGFLWDLKGSPSQSPQHLNVDPTEVPRPGTLGRVQMTHLLNASKTSPALTLYRVG